MNPPIRRLAENAGLAYTGDAIDRHQIVTPAVVGRWLAARNSHGKSNGDVLRPCVGAVDVLRHPQNRWIIDFPPEMDPREAALYQLPYARVRRPVRPSGLATRFGTDAAQLRVALAKVDRFIATPAAGRLRVLAWLPSEILPDRSLVVFARDDDWAFGVLQSRFHELCSLHTGVRVRKKTSGFRYSPAFSFETFPFPWPPATLLGKLTRIQDEQRTAIGQAARALDLYRREWLGDRSDPLRTLTALYNAKPVWLRDAHAALDEAVAAAYGWPADLPDDEVVSRLLALNRARSACT